MPVIKKNSEEEKKRKKQQEYNAQPEVQARIAQGNAEIGRMEKAKSQGQAQDSQPISEQVSVADVQKNVQGLNENILNPAEELKQQIITEKQNLDLTPNPIGEIAGGGLEKVGGATQPLIPDTQELIGQLAGLTEEQRNVLRGMQTTSGVIAALGVAGSMVAPAVLSIATTATSGFLGAIGGALLGGFLGTGGGFPGTSIGQKDIDTSKAVIEEMSQAPMDYIGLVQSGYPPQMAISDLRQQNERLQFHLARIKEKGNLNYAYRTSEEYFEIQEKTISAQNAMIEAIGAIQNLASTGQTDINFDNMIFYSESLNEKTKKIK